MDEKDAQKVKGEGVILIVDDTPLNIDVLRRTLEVKGYQILVATNGEMALKIAGKSNPDLILLDIMMPGIDGYETCRRLKQYSATREIPVIFITAKNDTNDIVKGFNAGGVDYIVKPFRQEEALARVSTHLHLQFLMRDLEEKNRNLTELNDLKNKFLGIASHDLRNPLASIEGFSKVLLKDWKGLPESSRQEFLGIIHDVSRNMLGLVNDLLDVSIIESGRLELDLKESLLQELIMDRVRLRQLSARDKNIKIHVELDELPAFKFDSNRLGQVIDNLIGNAMKFSPAGKNIYVRLGRENGFARVSVQDEGPGLSEEDQGKLFQHFQKLSARPTGGESSSGLGLAIVKKMVEGHGGSISATSQLGQGATFTFKIPI